MPLISKNWEVVMNLNIQGRSSVLNLLNLGGVGVICPFLIILCSLLTVDSTAKADEKDVDWIILQSDDQGELSPEAIKNKTIANTVGVDEAKGSLLNKLIDGGHVVADQNIFRNSDSYSVSTILENSVTRHRLFCIAEFNLSGGRIFESCNEI
jgi:hypothetical protein